MPKRPLRDKYSPAAYALYEYRITQREIAEKRRPTRTRQYVGFELDGRTSLTEETVDAIEELSGGNTELVEDVKRLARVSFIQRNPDRPQRHAFRPRKVTA